MDEKLGLFCMIHRTHDSWCICIVTSDVLSQSQPRFLRFFSFSFSFFQNRGKGERPSSKYSLEARDQRKECAFEMSSLKDGQCYFSNIQRFVLSGLGLFHAGLEGGLSNIQRFVLCGRTFPLLWSKGLASAFSGLRRSFNS